MSDNKDLYVYLGIKIDSLIDVGVKGRSKIRKQIRCGLFELFKVEFEYELRRFCKDRKLDFNALESSKQLDRPLFIQFLNFIDMIMSSEFGLEMDMPNKKKMSTKDMNLGEYLKFVNETED